MTDIARDRWGRPLIKPVGGGKPIAYARASGIGKVLEDDTNLAYWRARVVAIGLANRPDLQALVLGHQDHKDQELRNAVEEAFKAGGGEARRNQGTALHKLSELADWDHLPPELRADLDAYRACLNRHGLTELESETFVVHDGWKIAGTFDRLLMAPDGRIMTGDIKTGSSVEYGQGSWACQLAVYANGLRYDPETGERSPVLPDESIEGYHLDRDTGIIIHLPAGEGRCDLYEIDLRPGVEAIERALWVKDWRNRSRRLLTKIAPPAGTGTTATAPAPAGGAADYAATVTVSDGKPTSTGTPGDLSVKMITVIPSEDARRRDHLVRRYQQLRDQGIDAQTIAAVWPEGVPGPKRAAEWGLMHFAVIGTALNRIEAAKADGFTEPDPAPERPDPHRSASLRTPSIDEGPDMELDDCDAVRAKVDSLPDDQRAAVGAIVAACHAAGKSISMKQRPSQRRWSIARALYLMGLCGDLAQPDEERLRALCAHVTSDDACLMPGVSIGEVVGTLSCDQAVSLAELAQRGVTYKIDDVGDIRVAVAA